MSLTINGQQQQQQSVGILDSPEFVGLTLSGLTASRVVVTDGSKGLASSAVTDTELGYLSGVTGAIQNQIDNIDGSQITSGTINIDRLPATAIERVVVVADQAARYALTTGEVQNGDVVRQTDTGIMYAVYDDTNLGNANGYITFYAGTAAAVDWSGVTNIPSNLTTYAQNINQSLDTSASPTFVGVTLSGLTANRALVSNGSKAITASVVTSTELGYVSGVTSAIQTQLNAKQALDTTLTALANLDATAGYLTQTGADTFVRRTLTGTPNQVIVSNGDGTVGNPVFSLPQDIHTGASPTFVGLTLSGLSVSKMVTTNGSKALATVYDVNQSLATTSSPTFASGTYIRQDQNAGTSMNVRNDTAGTDAASNIIVTEGNYTSYGALVHHNTSFTTTGLRTANSVGLFSYGATNGLRVFTRDSTNLTLGTNNTARMTINSSGNFGINTTDIESWGSTYRVFEWTKCALVGHTSSDVIYLTSNSYVSDVWRYKTTAPASNMFLSNGAITLRTAVSGTIDTAISWVTRLTVDTTGVKLPELTASRLIGLNSSGYITEIAEYNVSGAANIIFGDDCPNLSTGSSNNGLGTSVFANITSGELNNGFGQLTLNSITDGSENTAFGHASFRYINGDGNTGIGYNSGRYYGSGYNNLTSGSYHTLLGYETRPSANGTTNEVVIGKSAVANGSNTATIGNTSCTAWYMGSTLMVNQAVTTTSNVQFNNAEIDGALNHDGSTVGFFATTPVAQQSHIADASGGATVDAEARAAINAALAVLESFGFVATS